MSFRYQPHSLVAASLLILSLGVPQADATPVPEEIARLLASDGAANDFFGWSVALSGNRALIGAYRDDDSGSSSGSAYVFERLSGSWVQTAKLVAADATSNDQFGISVALDGTRALIGAPGDDDTASSGGAAYVFDLVNGTWSQSAKLVSQGALSSDRFGFAVALDGDRTLVGAWGEDTRGSSAGAAYIHERIGGSWQQTAKLLASDGAASDNYGRAVALDGGTAVVGSYRADIGTQSNAGAAYVYTLGNGGAWTQSAKLVANTPGGGDQFGSSVAVAGGKALIGACCDDDQGANAGAAYLFDGAQGWAQIARLVGSDTAAGDQIGFAVGFDGTHALLGAWANDDAGSSSGSAYIFADQGGAWTEIHKLTSTGTLAGDRFGHSVAVSNSQFLISGPYADPRNLSSAGDARLFALAAPVPPPSPVSAPALAMVFALAVCGAVRRAV